MKQDPLVSYGIMFWKNLILNIGSWYFSLSCNTLIELPLVLMHFNKTRLSKLWIWINDAYQGTKCARKIKKAVSFLIRCIVQILRVPYQYTMMKLAVYLQEIISDLHANYWHPFFWTDPLVESSTSPSTFTRWIMFISHHFN